MYLLWSSYNIIVKGRTSFFGLIGINIKFIRTLLLRNNVIPRSFSTINITNKSKFTLMFPAFNKDAMSVNLNNKANTFYHLEKVSAMHFEILCRGYFKLLLLLTHFIPQLENHKWKNTRYKVK